MQQVFKYITIRGGQYRGTVTRYFFSTVTGNVGTFSKKYRFCTVVTFSARLPRYSVLLVEASHEKVTHVPLPFFHTFGLNTTFCHCIVASYVV